MPTLHIHGAELHYDDVGHGPETIVFIHGLMLASESYAAQREAFCDRYRVITFDLRGQGRSANTRERLDLDSLAEDTVALVNLLGRTGHAVMIERAAEFNLHFGAFIRRAGATA
jgi:pimeloyl-ACP methyl ester carboxylesterase